MKDKLYNDICAARQNLSLQHCMLPYIVILTRAAYKELSLTGHIQMKKYNKGRGSLYGLTQAYLDDMKVLIIDDKENKSNVEFVVMQERNL